MKVILLSPGETLRLRIKTLPVLLMDYQWSREQKYSLLTCTFTHHANTRGSRVHSPGLRIGVLKYFVIPASCLILGSTRH